MSYATCGAGTVHSRFLVGFVLQYLVFVYFLSNMFLSFCPFFLFPLYCIFYFDLIFYVDTFFPLLLPIPLLDLTVYMSNTAGF
jgi:hypothetical protein